MNKPFSITLPTPKNPRVSSNLIEVQNSLLFIGANGSGKTRLGVWIEFQSSHKGSVHRISAQKRLAMPNSTTLKDIKIAKQELLYGNSISSHYSSKNSSRWNTNPAVSQLNDFDKLIAYLFSEQTEENAKYMRMSKASPEKIVPPITKLDKVKSTWEKILPHRELVFGGLKIQTQTKENDKAAIYNCSEMSDGERVVFYLIGQCLAAPENGVIIIDEPEIHLHKSIQAPLWREIERLRPDCLFIYMTHDVDFAAALTHAKKIWLKGYDGSTWDWEEVPDIEGLPESLLIEILGSRKSIVFVEGENGSYDIALYRAILNEYLVIPCGSCSQVIQIVKAFKASEKLHHLDVSGIIDRDRRTDNEINLLSNDNIYTLDVAEVENLFCVPEIIKLVSHKLERNQDGDIQSVNDFVISKISNEIEAQVSLRVISEVKFRLNCLDEKAKGIDQIKYSLNKLTSSIDIEQIYNENLKLFNKIVKDRDYPAVLKLYNRKSLASQIGSILGLTNKEYPKYVIRIANSQDNSLIRQALKSYFGKFSDKITD